jgi:uncharacterized peroxidase-related enzyme
MGRFNSLPEPPVLADVFARFPDAMRELCRIHDIKLRGPSPLGVAEREMIAAYVSGLNACNYCHGAHRMIAESQGMDPAVFESLLNDPAQAGIDERLLPILAYVKKLTETPSRMTDRDAEAVYAAGWDEQALFDAVFVCALFNFMNRLVEGCGVQMDEAALESALERYEKMKDSPEPYSTYAIMAGVPE